MLTHGSRLNFAQGTYYPFRVRYLKLSPLCPEPLMARLRRPVDRPLFKRTKYGCITCRRRKKKCDEVKPRCAGCKRNDLQCCWAEESPLETSPSGSANQACSISLQEEALSIAARDGQNAVFNLDADDLERPVIEDAELTWHPAMHCYLASIRPALFTPHSTLFLRHYITTTGVMLPMPLTSNAFLETVLPLACKDDMLMHSVLALGGAHMSCDRTMSSMQQVRDSMLRHYIWTIHQVRKELASFDTQNYAKTIRLVLVLMLLCHVEVRILTASSSTFLTLALHALSSA